MRWIAMGLAVLSGFLSMLSVGAAFIGILPARGGEPIFHFAGVCLMLAVVVGLAATSLGGVSVFRHPGPARPVSSIVGLVLGAAALLGSLGLAAFVFLLDAKGKSDQHAIEDGKTRHQKPLTDAELASARPIDATALVAEWKRDHDASDRAHRGQILRTSFDAGGADWVDGADCVFLQGHGDVVCCMASGQPVPGGRVEMIFRYAETDRRYATPGRDQGKLVLDSCRVPGG